MWMWCNQELIYGEQRGQVTVREHLGHIKSTLIKEVSVQSRERIEGLSLQQQISIRTGFFSPVECEVETVARTAPSVYGAHGASSTETHREPRRTNAPSQNDRRESIRRARSFQKVSTACVLICRLTLPHVVTVIWALLSTAFMRNHQPVG